MSAHVETGGFADLPHEDRRAFNNCWGHLVQTCPGYQLPGDCSASLRDEYAATPGEQRRIWLGQRGCPSSTMGETRRINERYEELKRMMEPDAGPASAPASRPAQ